jgi:capsular exopolysaccharide synthesis family protein
MSKNFELLTHVEEDAGLFQAAERRVEPSVTKEALSPLGVEARDEVAKLVQNIFLTSREGRTPRAVAFCGIERGDGTSWICAQVARALAAQGATAVCAVDANLRSPGLHTYLGTINRCGFAEAIRETGPIRKFIESGPLVNLSVLPAGVNGDPSLLLISNRLRERVAELRSEFDYLIFDVPAVANANDGAVLGALLDGMVLVVGAHSTRRETARRAKENLEKGNVRLLGTVLNGRTFPIPDSLYRRL